MTKPRIKSKEAAIRRWLARHEKWFQRNPDREYLLTTITPHQMGNLAWSVGIFAGCASACFGGAEMNESKQELRVEPKFLHTSKRGPRRVHCIVRRANLNHGNTVPEVFLLDGTTTAVTPPCGGPPAEIDQEGFCAAWWNYAVPLQALGLKLRWKPSELTWTPNPSRDDYYR